MAFVACWRQVPYKLPSRAAYISIHTIKSQKRILKLGTFVGLSALVIDAT
jgi:predicted O-methyltransferase YrrM